MTETKVLRWTSSGNAWALGAQSISLLIPVLTVVGVYDPIALAAIGAWVAETWQWVLLVTAAVSISATLVMHLVAGDGTQMQAVARVEGIATAIVAVCYFALWAALVREYGFAANPLTQLLVGGLGLAALARVAQILWDSWRYRRALRRGLTARVEAIAQPKGT